MQTTGTALGVFAMVLTIIIATEPIGISMGPNIENNTNFQEELTTTTNWTLQEDVEEQEEFKSNEVEGTKIPPTTTSTVSSNSIGKYVRKGFHEIKPPLVDNYQHQDDTITSKTTLTGRNSARGKFGPYFEDGEFDINITARIGSTLLIDCKIGMLGDKQVTWMHHVKDSLRLLTVGMIPYQMDQRISLNFRYPSNWRLQILYASPRDSGLYKCQVATDPPLEKRIHVSVTAPILKITDDTGKTELKERHLKAESSLKLRCEAKDIMETLNETVVWRRGDETLIEDMSENKTMETLENRDVIVIASTLVVEKAGPRHAGNYSCIVPGKAKVTVAVHVLNGELPAAVHDGNGVSRAVLNLWLIHLAVSFVFSR